MKKENLEFDKEKARLKFLLEYPDAIKTDLAWKQYREDVKERKIKRQEKKIEIAAYYHNHGIAETVKKYGIYKQRVYQILEELITT